MPKRAANQIRSGLKYTETEAKPRASAAIALKIRSIYVKNCFNGIAVLFLLHSCFQA